MADERVEIKGDPNPTGDKEHDAKMAEKFDNQLEGKPEEKPAEEETLLAGKYKTPEELERGYLELQKKLGSREAGEAKDSDDTPKDAPADEPEDDQKAEAQKAGVDTDALEQEFAKNGKLSEESYADLEAKGIPRAMVDNYIAGRQASADIVTMKAHAAAGGEDAFKAMVDWAGQNFTEEQAKAFNDGVMGSTDDAVKAVESLKAAYVEANGKEPSLVQGDNEPVTADVYESRAQLTADINNPLYKKDSAFRKKVEQKLARSKLF